MPKAKCSKTQIIQVPYNLGRLTRAELQIVRIEADEWAVAAAALAAYHPTFDQNGNALRTVLELIKQLCSVAAAST